jgi:peptide/nickel transport system permease protein
VTLSLKERSFVDAAIVAGASESRLIFRHIAPNVLPYTFLYMTFNISGAIITEAVLAFLGYGDVNSITWGMMLQFLQLSGHALTAWWWLLPPGIAITLLSLSFYLIGRAFDEVVNPRLRKR